MKFRKLVMCGVFAAAAAVVSVPSAVSVSAAETVTGKTVAFDSKIDAADSRSAEKDLQETTQETTEVSEWANRLLVVVEEDTGLNIRSEANTDAEVVGQLQRGDGAEIVEKGEEWTKIVSGDVEGYIKNEYCLFEDEAEAQAEEICGVVATVMTDGLRIRSEANVDSKVLDVVDTGDSLSVVVSTDDAEAADSETIQAETDAASSESDEPEWIQVDYNGTTAYVSAEYVEVAVNVGEAKSMEEILQERAAKSSASVSQDGAGVSQGSAVSASTDDVTLLAAIIQCEAGSESYAGQLAVGAVVMNRVKSGAFPNSISGVVYQSGQFSPASSGKLSRILSSGSISSSCYQAASAAISGVDNTGGALYFHAGSGSGLVIGNQVFY